jgi:hypothetical protein
VYAYPSPARLSPSQQGEIRGDTGHEFLGPEGASITATIGRRCCKASSVAPHARRLPN